MTESFLPQVNGVTNSVLRVCEQLERQGHEGLVVAPGPGPTSWAGVPVIRTPSIPLPFYSDFRLARPYAGLERVLQDFQPDLVHLASPAVLGAQGAFAARRLGIPSVAVYQTDLAGFATRYRLAPAREVIWRWLREVHGAAARTLAPSTAALAQLEDNGIERVQRWARGVDLRRFHPSRLDPTWRRSVAPHGEVIVGYVGRLAAEKELDLLAPVQGLPGVRLVVVGDGPQRRSLQRRLPDAHFLGFRSGNDLARCFASLDVFVHPGSHETFCQAAQEALASGVPVVGPAAGGLTDLVDSGRTGLLFAPGSAADLARNVQVLTDDLVLRRVLGRAARRSVQERSWDAIGDQLMGHYAEVLSA